MTDWETLRSRASRPLPAESYDVDGTVLTPEQVVAILSPYVTSDRMARIDRVIGGRTYTVATVVEGLIDMGNVSAVMRSAEALGFQSFHLVTGGEKFKHSARTSQGADKWLDVHLWPSPSRCVEHLKAQGYAVLATHLDDASIAIDEIDFTRKIALVFGNEAEGLSDAMLEAADQRCVLPMAGFVQSFNISVAAAVSLYHAYRDRLGRQGYHGDLSAAQRARLRAAFCVRSVRRARGVLSEAVSRGDYEGPVNTR